MTDLQTMPTVAAAAGAPAFEPIISKSESRSGSTHDSANEMPGAPRLEFRLLGLVGAVGLFACGLTLMGAHPSDYLQLAALLIIVSLSFFGLIASHGPRMVGRLLAVTCGSLARNEAEAGHLRNMCRRGRQLSYSGGILTLLVGIIHVLSVLDRPEVMGPGFAVALVGPVLAVMIAELGFGAATHWVRIQRA
ncbi:MAG: hypothetical protein ACI89X_004712 [Planctomycetota bacterium]|jgi:hypothetical protein